jgi:acyl-coenzyme A thioesterase PaaI-like protein
MEILEKLDNIKKYKEIPTHLLDNNCFACGSDNPDGLQMRFFTDEKYLFSEVYLSGNKRGWEQLIHGGIISTILDEIMGWSAIYFTKQFILTKSIKVDYINSLVIDSTVKAVGWIENKKNDKEIKMKAQIYDSENKLCAEAVGEFALFSKKLATRLRIMSEETIEQFDLFISSCS